MESFPEAIDAVALKAPGRLAMVVTTDGSSLTYERLATCSVFVARGLLALGVSSKQPLLSHMRRGCEWYILYVALSRLGVPLAAMPGQGHDQSHELRDLRWTQLLALKPQLLVVDGDALPVEVDLPRHRFDDVLDMGAPLNQELPDVCADDVLCYCFTGGTTGRQRCVPVTQRMALHELRHYEVALHWTGDAGNEDDCARVLQASSLYWASAVFGQLDLALALQGCAVVSEDIDVKDLAHTVREQRVNILGLPPSMLGLMDPLDFIDMRSQGGYCHVRRLISWGEPCPEAIAYTWGASRWPWRFLDILISTEYWLSFVASERDAEGRSRFTPVKDLEVYLHPLGRTAEDEDFSELCLRGPGVCERLHSADGLDLTEAFLEHQGQRFYRSGDLAKWSGQDIVFRGRGDQLVKVFGKWVDLSDLSRRLSNLPGVLEAATITGGPDEHHAVAVLDKRSNPDSFAAAYRILPSGGGVQLHWFSEPLPRKAETQKVDRARLLSQLRGMAGMASAPVTPLPRRKGDTRQEDALLASVVEVLGNTSCSSLQSSFLACGGDSVTALRCAAAARQRGLEISALALLSARTLAEAAKAEESEPLQKRPRLAPESGSFTRTQPFALTAEELQEEISFQLGLPSRAVDCSWRSSDVTPVAA